MKLEGTKEFDAPREVVWSVINDPAKMAMAMKLAIEAGRLACVAGRMQKRLYASASSPIAGVVR